MFPSVRNWTSSWTKWRDVVGWYTTVCDASGVSGDYQKFALDPPRDKKGNFFVTLNVAPAGGIVRGEKSPWRGWCVKQITPEGEVDSLDWVSDRPTGHRQFQSGQAIAFSG